MKKITDVGAVLQLVISYSPKAKGLWTQSLQFDLPLWVKMKYKDIMKTHLPPGRLLIWS